MRVMPAAPDADALRSSALASILPAVALGMLAAAVIAEIAGFGAAYAWRAFAFIGAGAAMLVLGLGAHLPHRHFGAANQLTLVRATLIALLLAMIGQPRIPVAFAFGIAVLAASLDVADGRVARGSGMTSPYGARFDMETDALLILALSVLLWRSGILGAWVLASGAMRYVFVLVLRLFPRLRAPLAPSVRRQTFAVIQVVGLLIAFAPFTPAVIAQGAAAAGLAGLLLSFGIDLRASWRAGARAA
jgi:phosphatidylglycerophosphate synthase